tara:strand:- start:165 stop:347 length:183 start_codon:yes stop_codon:yes gene_type:complete
MSEQELNKMEKMMDYAVFSDSYSQTELAILYEKYIESYKEFNRENGYNNDYFNKIINPWI